MAKIFSIKGDIGFEEFFTCEIEMQEDAPTLEIAQATSEFFSRHKERMADANGDILTAYALLIANFLFSHGWDWNDGADNANAFFRGELNFETEGWAPVDKQGFKILRYDRINTQSDLEIEITDIRKSVPTAKGGVTL